MTDIDDHEAETALNASIEVIHKGECLSVSGRSTLKFEIGRHREDRSLFLRISDNTGKGMWCATWCSASDIQEIVLGEQNLTAKSFHALHPGKSVNTGGFILASLRALGLIRINAENLRIHEHVLATTFEKVVAAHMAQSKGAMPEAGGRKTLKLKPKEG